MASSIADLTTIVRETSSQNPHLKFEVVLDRIYSLEEADNVRKRLQDYIFDAAERATIDHYTLKLRIVQSTTTQRYHLLGETGREVYEKIFDAKLSHINGIWFQSGYVLPINFKRQIRFIHVLHMLPDKAVFAPNNRIAGFMGDESSYSPNNRITPYLH